MSTILDIQTEELHEALRPLSKLFPKGSKTVPIGLHVEDGELTVVCQQGLVYQAILDAGNTVAVAHATILYFDITSLLTGDVDSMTHICFEVNHVKVYNEVFSIVLQHGYSVVDKVTYINNSMNRIAQDMYLNGIKSLAGMKLNNLYHMQTPICIINNVMLQKFPNTWVQVRADGLNIRAIIDLEHLQLLSVFKPEFVSDVNGGIITFKRKKSILRIACKPLQDSDKITAMMDELNKPVPIKLGRYADNIATLLKYESHITCQVALYATGLCTTVNSNGVTFSASTGEASGELIKVFHYPADVWYAFLRVLGVDRIEILYGGDKVCLRSSLAVIVTRVLH